MLGFTDLIRRHRVDPGRLVHVGAAQGSEISTYYEAGFYDVAVVDFDPERTRVLRNRYPGVEIDYLGRLDAAKVLVINQPGQELEFLDSAPWDDLILLIVSTSADGGPSPYDLVIEAVTTRGFVEVDQWEKSHGGGGADLDVAFMKVAD
jgi:hypothetical protein